MAITAFIKKVHQYLLRIESATLIVILMSTIIIAVVQIFLRNVMHSGIAWGDTLVRILVLWLGLTGAMIASRERRHIRIDILSRFLGKTARAWLGRITDIIAALVCWIIAWYGLDLIKIEYQDGMTAFANIPVWLTEAIIPFAFTVMGTRYFIYIFLPRPGQAE